ncbi:MAG: hypothetical protein MUO72_13375 [Bacteroidales bacterium]|nr:hypothetical protein [Bacteroidales bacterium]
MKKPGKIFAFIILFLFTGHICLAQDLFQQRDTLQLKIKKSESVAQGKEQGAKGNQGNQAGNSGKGNASQKVKQVKGARPDMSKAKGARPPSIVRPSGSGIPKGIGKPGGVGKRGGR